MILDFLDDLPVVGGLFDSPEVPGLNQIPGLAGILGPSTDLPPVVAKTNWQSFQNKWTPALPKLRSLFPDEAWGSVMEIDAQRAAAGQPVLSGQDTIKAITAAATGNRVTPESEPNIIEKAATDIRELVTGLPQLPLQLISEVQEAPEGVQGAIENITQGKFAEATQQPGVRLIPGTYVAGSILSGENPFAEHPIYSLLDVLPFAEMGVARLPGVEAARIPLLEAGKIRQASPLRTFIREYIRKPTSQAVEKYTGFSIPNQFRKWGLASDNADIAAFGRIAGRGGTEEWAKLTQILDDQLAEYADITPERRVEIQSIVRSGDPERLRSMSVREKAYADVTRAWIEKYLKPLGLEEKGIMELTLPGLGEEIYGRAGNKAQTLRSLVARIPKLERQLASLDGSVALNDQILTNQMIVARGLWKHTYGQLNDGQRMLQEMTWRLPENKNRLFSQWWEQNGMPTVEGSNTKLYGDLSDQQVRAGYDALADVYEQVGERLEPNPGYIWNDRTGQFVDTSPIKQFLDVPQGVFRRRLLELAANNKRYAEIFSKDANEGVFTRSERSPEFHSYLATTGRDMVLTQINRAYNEIADDVRRIKPNELAPNRPQPSKLTSQLRSYTQTVIDGEPRWIPTSGNRPEILFDKAKGPIFRAIKGLESQDIKAVKRNVDRLYRHADELRVMGEPKLSEALTKIADRANSYFDYREASRDLVSKNATLNGPGGLRERYDTVRGTFDEVNARYNRLLLDEDLIPQRWRDYVYGEYQKKLAPVLATLPEEAQVAARQAIDQGYQMSLAEWGVPERVLRDMRREATAMWPEAKRAGLNPQYSHAIDANQVRSLYRTIEPLARQVKLPSQFKQSMFDSKPIVANLELSAKHQARELMQYRVDRQVREHIRDTYGITQEQAMAKYLPIAQRQVEMGLAPPGYSVGTVLNDLIRNEFIDWDASSLTPTTPGRSHRRITGALEEGATSTERLYIPKWVDETMKKMYPQMAGLGGLLTGAHNIFRSFILPFSPQWHLNNILSGGVMLFARTGPGVARYLRDAAEMVREGTVPIEIARGSVSIDPADAAFLFHGGKFLGEAGYNSYVQNARKLGQRVKTAAEWAYDKGEFIDQTYRVAAYLYGENKAARLGLSEQAARTAGIELANSILQNWDRMTPVERQTMRMIFPFYGWMKHVLSYTLTLPIDHPMRTAILANFARNEWEDWGTGIPERFNSMLAIGQPDRFGNVKAIDLKRTNPFSDFANYMTLAGFVSQLSPVAEGLLTSMGINPVSGKPDQFAPTQYNPQTGKLETKTPNPITSIIESVIPQSQFVLPALGLTGDELRVLKVKDPQAYRNRVLSALGIPFLPKDLNLQREAALAEISRDQGATDAFNEARRTGDWSYAITFPQIRPYYYYLRAANQQGMLDPFLATRPTIDNLSEDLSGVAR